MINFGKLFDIKSSHPDTIALKIGDRSIAYDELISKAMKVASFLVALGQNGSTVGLVGHRTASTHWMPWCFILRCKFYASKS